MPAEKTHTRTQKKTHKKPQNLRKDKESRRRQSEISISGITSASSSLKVTGATCPNKGIKSQQKERYQKKAKNLLPSKTPMYIFFS